MTQADHVNKPGLATRLRDVVGHDDDCNLALLRQIPEDVWRTILDVAADMNDGSNRAQLKVRQDAVRNMARYALCAQVSGRPVTTHAVNDTRNYLLARRAAHIKGGGLDLPKISEAIAYLQSFVLDKFRHRLRGFPGPIVRSVAKRPKPPPKSLSQLPQDSVFFQLLRACNGDITDVCKLWLLRSWPEVEEICRLRARDITFVGPHRAVRLALRNENDRVHRIVFLPRLGHIFMALKAPLKAIPDKLVFTRVDGQPHDPKDFQNFIDTLLERSGRIPKKPAKKNRPITKTQALGHLKVTPGALRASNVVVSLHRGMDSMVAAYLSNHSRPTAVNEWRDALKHATGQAATFVSDLSAPATPYDFEGRLLCNSCAGEILDRECRRCHKPASAPSQDNTRAELRQLFDHFLDAQGITLPDAARSAQADLRLWEHQGAMA